MPTLDYASSSPPRPFNALPLKIATLCTTYILLLLTLTKLNFNPWRPTPIWLDYAHLIGVSVIQEQAWRQGRRFPNPTARRLFDEIQHDPTRWTGMLQPARATLTRMA